MDKPIIVGQAILGKSKELMYEFYYDYLQPKYKDKLKLLYMDTDSFILEIETDEFYQDTKKDLKEWFDTSKYHKDMVLPKDYRENASLNKKVIGKMKDELNKGHMSEFIALSPKVSAGIWYKDMVLPKDYRENASLNKNVIGKMKDELNKGHMSEFIVLSPNVYAYQQVEVDKILTEDKKKLEVPVNV